MENKNILLVIASVCLFFVIVVGVGLIILWPKKTASSIIESAATRPIFNDNFDTFEFYKSSDEIPGLMRDEGEETSLEDQAAADGSAPTGPEEDSDAIRRVFGEVAEEGVLIEEKDQKPAPVSTLPPPQKNTTGSASAATAASSRTRTTLPSTRQVRPEPKIVYVKEYEIQVGSYKSINRAEDINERLKELGLPGIIKTRDIGGETYFRVRIGPYTDQNEASKFLSWIKNVEGLEDSYISQVTRRKTVN